MLPQGFGDMLKQAQALQQKIAALQQELGQKTVEATAGGGMVTVRVNGRQEIVAVMIDQTAVNPQEISLLQDLIIAATNEALRRSRELLSESLKDLTGGLPFPGLGLP